MVTDMVMVTMMTRTKQASDGIPGLGRRAEGGDGREGIGGSARGVRKHINQEEWCQGLTIAYPGLVAIPSNDVSDKYRLRLRCERLNRSYGFQDKREKGRKKERMVNNHYCRVETSYCTVVYMAL